MSDWLANVVRFAAGVQPSWRGTQPSQRQRLYFANHASHLDTLVLWSVLPPELRVSVRPVAARDYWSRGLRARIARAFNAVLIDRSRADQSADPLAPLHEVLERGGSLIFFPEGTRSPEGEIRPLRGGLYHLAQQHPNVELVPVYLGNLHRILPKGTFLPVPLPGSVVFGAPLPRVEAEPKVVFLARALQALLALKPSCSNA